MIKKPFQSLFTSLFTTFAITLLAHQSLAQESQYQYKKISKVTTVVTKKSSDSVTSETLNTKDIAKKPNLVDSEPVSQSFVNDNPSKSKGPNIDQAKELDNQQSTKQVQNKPEQKNQLKQEFEPFVYGNKNQDQQPKRAAKEVVKKSENNSGKIKTEGHYVGLDLVRTDSSFVAKGVLYGGAVTPRSDQYKHKGYGASISYKYAFNYKGFFLAPGVFYDQTSIGANNNSGYQKDSSDNYLRSRLSIKNRFGGKVDFGYDLLNYFSPYLTFGYAVAQYSALGTGTDLDNNPVSKTHNGYKGNVFYGIGARINLRKTISLNFEYTTQRLTTKAGIPDASSDYFNKNTFDARLNIIKIGLLYNF